MSRLILPVLFFLSSISFAEEFSVVGNSVTPPSIEAELAATSASTKALKETDIPVHLEAAKKGANGDSPWMRMLAGLAVVGILAAGSFVFVKKAKNANRTSSLAPEIKVLAQHFLGPKKSLAIIRIAGESILLGVTDNNINLIKSLSLLDEDIPEVVPSNFKSVFGAAADEAPAGATASGTKEEAEEFSISGIKDVVTSRLKNMRTFQ